MLSFAEECAAWLGWLAVWHPIWYFHSAVWRDIWELDFFKDCDMNTGSRVWDLQDHTMWQVGSFSSWRFLISRKKMKGAEDCNSMVELLLSMGDSESHFQYYRNSLKILCNNIISERIIQALISWSCMRYKQIKALNCSKLITLQQIQESEAQYFGWIQHVNITHYKCVLMGCLSNIHSSWFDLAVF